MNSLLGITLLNCRLKLCRRHYAGLFRWRAYPLCLMSVNPLDIAASTFPLVAITCCTPHTRHHCQETVAQKIAITCCTPHTRHHCQETVAQKMGLLIVTLQVQCLLLGERVQWVHLHIRQVHGVLDTGCLHLLAFLEHLERSHERATGAYSAVTVVRKESNKAIYTETAYLT